VPVAIQPNPLWRLTQWVCEQPALTGFHADATTHATTNDNDTASSERFVRACVTTRIPGWIEELRPVISERTDAFAASVAERLTGRTVKARRIAGDELQITFINETPDSRAARTEQARVDNSVSHAPIDTLEARTPDGGAASDGVARTFLGWGESTAVSCFALCLPSRDAEPASESPLSNVADNAPTAEILHTAQNTQRQVVGASCRARLSAASLAHESGISGAPPPPGALLGALAAGVHHPSLCVGLGLGFVVALSALCMASRPKPRLRAVPVPRSRGLF